MLTAHLVCLSSPQGLLSRLSQTESAVAALAGQLAQINTSIASLLPTGFSSATPTTDHSRGYMSAGSPPHDATTTETIKLLTTQVVALSTSVSQLQSLAVQQATTSSLAPPHPYAGAASPGVPSGAGNGNPFEVQPPPPSTLSRSGAAGFNLILPSPKVLTPTSQAPPGPSPFGNGTAPASPRASANIGALGSQRFGVNGAVGGGAVGGAASPRPGMGRSLSSFVGSAAGGGADAKPRRPGGFGRVDSYEVRFLSLPEHGGARDLTLTPSPPPCSGLQRLGGRSVWRRRMASPPSWPAHARRKLTRARRLPQHR